MTKTSLVALFTLAALAAPSAARAQAGVVVDRPGFDLGLRLGYAIPFGDVNGTSGLASQFSGGIPFVLEGGYRFNRTLTLGLTFQYAVLSVKDNGLGCGNGVSCSGSLIRLGPEILYHVPVVSRLAPWIGAGFGYEWVDVDSTVAGISGSRGAHGVEFLTLQAGGDVWVAPQFAIGPFVSFSFARYSTVTASAGGTETSTDIGNPAVHEWLQLGIRGAFSL